MEPARIPNDRQHELLQLRIIQDGRSYNFKIQIDSLQRKMYDRLEAANVAL
jgi:hypothetical protein